MKRKPFLIGLFFLTSLKSFSQSREAGTDLGAIKQYMKDRDTNTISPKTRYTQAIKSVLKQYNNAIEKLDLNGTDDLFTEDSRIYESGNNEGTYNNYRQVHLETELSGFKSFKISDYKVDVTLAGKYAFATEIYKYVSIAKDNTEVDGNEINTIVLKNERGQWKIAVRHNSSIN